MGNGEGVSKRRGRGKGQGYAQRERERRRERAEGKGNGQVERQVVGLRAHFLLEAAVLEVQGLDLLTQHSCNVALLTLCHHSPAGPGNAISLWAVQYLTRLLVKSMPGLDASGAEEEVEQ